MMRTSINLLLVFTLIFSATFAQEDSGEQTTKYESTSNEFNIRVQKVKDSIFMLTGKGGNIGLCIGKDGAFLIDDQFAESSANILNAVSRLTLNPIQFLVNTHHHPDHTGGNKNMRAAGITIFAHANVRNNLIKAARSKELEKIKDVMDQRGKKMESDGSSEEEIERDKERFIMQVETFDLEEELLPMITFEEDLTFHYNGEDILVFHVDNAHTDGDVLIYFTQSNVLHTGDAYVKDLYPFIDAEYGGSYEGYIKGLEKILMLIDEETLIIPGHGGVAKLADVRFTKSMMDFVYNSIAYQRVAGKTEDEVLAMKEITSEYDNKGFGKGFISTETFVRSAYKEVAKKYPWSRPRQGKQQP